MTKSTKRFFAGLLTAAMVIGTFTMVAAEPTELTDATNLNQTVSGDSTTQAPKIKIEVPTDASFVINPYKITVTNDGVSDNSAIISPKNVITNKSEVPVAVSVEEFVVDNGTYNTTTKKYSTGVKVLSGSALKAKDKSIYLHMVIGQKKTTAADENGVYTYEIGTGKKEFKDVKATAKISTKGTPAAGGSVKKAIVLGSGTWSGDNYSSGGEAVEYQIVGDVNANPTKVEGEGKNKKTVADPWTATESDKLKVSYKFTFEPQSN